MLDESHGWRCLSKDGWDIFFTGQQINPHLIAKVLRSVEAQEGIAEVTDRLLKLKTEWAFIAHSERLTVSAVDPIRSYPIFYSNFPERVLVSNSARMLRDKLDLEHTSSNAITEFLTAGYVTSDSTLLKGLFQLRAGEYLVYAHNQSTPSLNRYYRYLPYPEQTRTTADWVDFLTEITKKIFLRLIERADGRQLLIPLSGGLDSRLIVTMLSYLKYDNVKTFSYGPRANYEARIAKAVAEKAGYPWEFYLTTHEGSRKFFWSCLRREYWDFSDGLSAVPNMQDIYPISMLKNRGSAENSIIVNGQSGDFISGGHLPEYVFQKNSRESVVQYIMSQHFSLRLSLRNTKNLQVIETNLNKSLDEITQCAGTELSAASLYEHWEWQERQCKYVIGGQRAYDFMGFNWALPLWDSDYLYFWSKVPYNLKLGQNLYKEFLKSNNYCNVFRDYNPTVWRWPGASIGVVPIAQVIGLLGGRRAKRNFYSYAKYIGHYGPQYAPWGKRKFFSEAIDARNALPFFIDTWRLENHL